MIETQTPAELKLNQLLNSTDRNGKKLIYKPDDGGRIYLDIDGDLRCLGAILLGNSNILYHKYEDAKNVFRKTNAWSINHTVLSGVDTVVYETLTHDYCITKERALEFGEFFHFQDTTELKVYVPLKYWEVRHKGLKDVHPEEFKWRNRVGDSWYPVLKETLHSDMMKSIQLRVQQDRKRFTVFPESKDVFKAFKLCSFEHTKVVILGQDPYYNGSANGLAFGYKDKVRAADKQSLDMIFAEIERDVYDGMYLDRDPSLVGWAKQGVLLLNTVLTVVEKQPRSHEDIGWERFSKIVLLKLMEDEMPKVFITWGTPAKQTYEHVEHVWQKKNFVPFPHLHLHAFHPAYDLRNKTAPFGEVTPDYPRTFAGNAHFSKTNEFLKKFGRKQIKW
jgi:uracil-DNA glycosylase